MAGYSDEEAIELMLASIRDAAKQAEEEGDTEASKQINEAVERLEDALEGSDA